MIDWLLQRFVPEVPEEIAFCEFDCPKSKCCVSDAAVCDLARQAMPGKREITRYVTRDEQPEMPVPVYARATSPMTL